MDALSRNLCVRHPYQSYMHPFLENSEPFPDPGALLYSSYSLFAECPLAHGQREWHGRPFRQSLRRARPPTR